METNEILSNNETSSQNGGSKPPSKPRRKTVSERQLAANRANAQKSTGPTSQTGKHIARWNNYRHGLCAKHLCHPGEFKDAYEARRQEYIQLFQPSNINEWDHVEDLVASRWRKQRAFLIETALMYETFTMRRLDVAKTYNDLSTNIEAALAFRFLSENSNILRLLDRYENTASRNIARDLKVLNEAVKNRPPAGENQLAPEPVSEPVGILPDEPIPEIEHSQEAEDIPSMIVTPRLPDPLPVAEKVMVAGSMQPSEAGIQTCQGPHATTGAGRRPAADVPFASETESFKAMIGHFKSLLT